LPPSAVQIQVVCLACRQYAKSNLGPIMAGDPQLMLVQNVKLEVENGPLFADELI